MWELIALNKRKSIVLFFLMGLLLLVLGYLIGSYFISVNGGLIGIALALGLWIVLSILSYLGGDQILLSMAGAKRVTPELHPQLFNVVEEMKIAAALPRVPEIYIIPDPAPNAFAVGRNPQKSAIAVTAGLLEMLSRDELQGVIAHETSHILNRDILFMTFSGVMLGSIVFLSHMFLRTFWITGGRKRSRNSVGGGRIQLILLLVSVIMAVLSPLIAQMLYFAISRKREYLADATAVRLTRYPEGLASALNKLSMSGLKLEKANKATAGLYIINPIKGMGINSTKLTSTHPPISKRVRILRNIGENANYKSYQIAYSKTTGKRGEGSKIIPLSGLYESKKIKVRKPTVTNEKPKSNKQEKRDLQDLIKAVNRFAFIQCACGLKIKIPPNFKEEIINCPRCGRKHEVPLAQVAAISEITSRFGGTKDNKIEKKNEKKDIQGSRPFVYTGKYDGWETFRCPCGSPKQLAPTYKKESFICNECGRKIILK